MKKITAFILFFLPIAIFAQCGIYKTQEDFINNKLTNPSKAMFKGQSGAVYTITLSGGEKREKININKTDIWGFKHNMTDFRVINHTAHAITAKGEIYMYSGPFDRFSMYTAYKSNDTCYFKRDNAFPYASKGIDGEIVQIRNPQTLYDMMDPKTAEKVKQANTGTYLEAIAWYYNTLRGNNLLFTPKRIEYWSTH